MKANVLFSIIIPMKNQEKYILNAIHSILEQSYLNYEIIVIDDHSTDNSISVVKQFKQVKLYSSLNSYGAGAARNIGIQQATGDYFIFLDSDDILNHKTVLEELSLELETNPDVLHCAHEVCWHQKTLIKKQFFLNFFQKRKWHKMIIQSGSVCSFVWKSSLFETFDILFPEETIFEDLNTKLQLISQANTIQHTSTLLFIYNIRNGKSTTTKQTLRNLLIFYKMCGKQYQLLLQGKIKRKHFFWIILRSIYDIPVTSLWITWRSILYALKRKN